MMPNVIMIAILLSTTLFFEVIFFLNKYLVLKTEFLIEFMSCNRNFIDFFYFLPFAALMLLLRTSAGLLLSLKA